MNAPSIDQLCRRHRNENAHTEHVTRLALQIFDAVGAGAGLRPEDRVILETAGRLHDIGYARHPTDHVRAGASIMLRGVRGVARRDWPQVAAVMLLHGGRWEDALDHRAFRRLADPGRVRRLGAMLRVADALDHGHIQDATVAGISKRRGRIVLRAASPGFAGNLAQAQHKADLWQAVMPIRLVIQAVPPAKPPWPYAAVLGPSHSALECARRLLLVNDRLVRAHVKLALVEDDPIHLHDIRVGLRRCRAVLRLFRDELSGTRAEALNGSIRRLSERLGPLRDADVWQALLQSRHIARGLRQDPRREAYSRRQRQLKIRNRRQLTSILKGAGPRQVLQDLGILLRVELPRLIDARRGRPARRSVGDRIERDLRRLTEREVFKASLSADAMHEVRVLTRRTRYWADFGAPLFGRPVAVLAKRLKGMADALGDMHDMDVALDRLAADKLAPQGLRALLRADRAAVLLKAQKAWRRLNKPGMLAAARQAIDG